MFPITTKSATRKQEQASNKNETPTTPQALNNSRSQNMHPSRRLFETPPVNVAQSTLRHASAQASNNSLNQRHSNKNLKVENLQPSPSTHSSSSSSSSNSDSSIRKEIHDDYLKELFYTLTVNEITKQKVQYSQTTRSGRSAKRINESEVIESIIQTHAPKLKVDFSGREKQSVKDYIMNKLEETKKRVVVKNSPIPKTYTKSRVRNPTPTLKTINESSEVIQAENISIPIAEAVPIQDSIQKETFDLNRLLELWKSLQTSIPQPQGQPFTELDSKQYQVKFNEIQTLQKQMVEGVETTYARAFAVQ